MIYRIFTPISRKETDISVLLNSLTNTGCTDRITAGASTVVCKPSVKNKKKIFKMK